MVLNGKPKPAVKRKLNKPIQSERASYGHSQGGGGQAGSRTPSLKSAESEVNQSRRTIQTLDGRGKGRKPYKLNADDPRLGTYATRGKEPGPEADWSLPELQSRYTRGP